MVLCRINILRVLAVLFLTVLFIVVLAFNSKVPEFSLIKAILPQNVIENSNIVNLSENNSSAIHLIFEKNDDDFSDFEQKVLSEINPEHFELIDIDFSKIIDYYSYSPANFLSNRTRKDLSEGNYTDVHNRGLEMLYNPVPVVFVDFSKDPYFLLADFLFSNRSDVSDKEIDGKFYSVKTLKIKQGVKTESVKELVKISKKYQGSEEKLYLSGTPVHTYLTSRSSSLNVNLICILITIFIIGLTWIYFGKLSLLLPVSLSIGFGFLGGISCAKAIFHDFHIITLLFAMTLIGIGIDYSIHFIFAQNHDKTFYKNLSLSFISTAVAFSLMFFLKIGILNQIALFTIVGLFCVYLFIVLIYPCLNFPEPKKTIDFNFNKNMKISLCIVSVFVLIFGLLRVKFDDNLSALYTPNGMLKQAEKLYAIISKPENTNTYFLTLKGNDFEDLAEKEEIVTAELENKGINYFSFSKLIPSKKRQRENFELVKGLYENDLDNFDDFLSKDAIDELKNEEFRTSDLNINEIPYLQNMLLNPETSVMIYFSPQKLKFQDDFIEEIDIQGSVSECLKDYRINLIKIIPFVYSLLILLIIIFYGIKRTVKMSVPIIFSPLFTLCLLSLSGVKLNLFHFIGILLVLGFTIDYTLFGTEQSPRTKNAIFLASMTTCVSFLLLSFTTFNLLNSLALTLFIGILSSYLFIKLFE